MNDKYGNLYYLDHPTSKIHKRMSIYNRAAQFSPFAALVGYEDLIIEKGRYVSDKIEIDEYKKVEINSILQYTLQKPSTIVSITYFVKDKTKDGGSYTKIETSVKKIDDINHLLYTNDGNIINIENIYSIDLV